MTSEMPTNTNDTEEYTENIDMDSIDIEEDIILDETEDIEEPQEVVEEKTDPEEEIGPFTHFHVHTQFSILDGAAPIKKLLKKVQDSGMKALAITDHGNMYGVLTFVKMAKSAGVKPIIGCELYVARNSRFDKDGKDDRSGHHLILLAKNMTGYKNLSRLCSLGFTEGFYYTPRIDKELLFKYSEGIIALSACLGGEIPSAIRDNNIPQAEKIVQEFVSVFKDDFYLELQNHGLEDQHIVNKELIRMSEKFGVKLIATNDVHFVNAEDAEAHDILVCLNTKKEYNDESRMRYSGQEYLKTPEEMTELFKQVPDAISNTKEIVRKIENIELKHDIILPTFPLPEGFSNDDDYLVHLTNLGAENLYPEITQEVRERIDYELAMVKQMGFAGYFLIVQDFINEARRMDVAVGPGRGSAAGSIIAFCTGITSVDPIKYNLLFERFLNPERISMPDVDIDFDDEGRDKVIQYVIQKYGKDRVAQIVTFGTMAAKSSVKSVARVLGLPLPEANRISNLIPSKPGTTLESAFKEVTELASEKKSPNKLIAKTLEMAEIMEGLSSHVGVHACGVIIGPDDLINYIPLSKQKGTDLIVTQYEGKIVEEVGLLKMDFLGLKTLSIIKDAVKNIFLSKQIKIDIEKVPLDDEITFNLYKSGDTVGTFQFESSGMRAHLKELKPTEIEDLIIMNALYRPGPMDNIPIYIRRKQGKEKAEYLHPIIEDIVKSTYGIMIFQEQIMQIAQKMAGYSLGKADILRKAMGKKNAKAMEEQHKLFVAGALKNNIDEKTSEKIFTTMAKFAEYGFNRSHSAAYSILAYKTAYLKANYPAEYMAAVLTHNLNDIKKITHFIEECLKQNIPVLGPDVNESHIKFTVNKKGEIRFGLGAVKNVGEAAALAIIEERNENGPYVDFFDFIKRSNLRSVNKRCLEALVFAGGFDSFPEAHRAQYFFKQDNEDSNFLEKAVRYGNNFQTAALNSQASLFGEESNAVFPNPDFIYCEPWSKLEQLKYEKEVIGFFLTGHPLDSYAIEIDKFCNNHIGGFKNNLKDYTQKEIRFAGIVTDAAHKTGKTGKPFGSFTLEDKTDSIKVTLFGQDYLSFKSYIENDYFLFVKGKPQPRYNSETELELKVHHISLLADLFERVVDQIQLQIPIHNINETLTASLLTSMKNNSGKCRVNISILDVEEKISLSFHSRLKVDASTFLKSIKHLDTIHLKIKSA